MAAVHAFSISKLLPHIPKVAFLTYNIRITNETLNFLNLSAETSILNLYEIRLISISLQMKSKSAKSLTRKRIVET